MRALVRQFLCALFLILLPLQGMLWLAAQVKGRLHTHDQRLALDKASLSHQHEKTRHYHAHNEFSVVIDQQIAQEETVIESGLLKANTSGWLAVMIPSATVFFAPALRFGTNPAPLLAFATRYLPRLERPPTHPRS